MRLAQIENGVVINVIEADAGNIPDWAAGWPDAEDAGPGWLVEDGVYSPPALVVTFAPLQRWQFMAMVRILGLEAQIEAAIDAIEDGAAKAVASARYQFSDTYHRDDALVTMLAAAVDLADSDVDAAWQQAMDL